MDQTFLGDALLGGRLREEGQELILCTGEAFSGQCGQLFGGLGRGLIGKFILRLAQQYGTDDSLRMQVPITAGIGAEMTVYSLAPHAPGLLQRLVLNEAGGQRAGFFQRLDTQHFEELLALFLRRFHGEGEQAELAIVGLGKGTAFHDGALEQAHIGRAGHLGADAHAASGLATDGDVLRITAKGRDIALHPAGGALLVKETEVGAGFRSLGSDLRVAQETKGVQPVAHGDHHDAAAGQTLAVKLHFGGVAHLQTTAEVPYIHRHVLAAIGGSPHVQVQAVLAHGQFRIHSPFPGVDILGRIASAVGLHGDGAEISGKQFAFPIGAGLGRTPAVLADGLVSKRNAFVAGNAGIGCGQTAHPSVFHFHFTDHFCRLL